MRGSKKANIVAMLQTKVDSGGGLALPGVANPFNNGKIRGNRLS